MKAIKILNLNCTMVTSSKISAPPILCTSYMKLSYQQVVIPQLFGSLLDVGGARGVTVIVEGNGHGDTSSNPERD